MTSRPPSTRLASLGSNVVQLAQQRSYHSLLVRVGPGPDRQERVRHAVTLANRFGSRLIGITGPADVVETGERPPNHPLSAQDPALQAKMASAGEQFKALTALAANDAVWSCRATSAFETLDLQADGADLLVFAPQDISPPKLLAASRPGSAVFLGRPALVLPPSTRLDGMGAVVVAWNDGPECRRAAMDAMPFLQRATQVTFVHVRTELDVLEAGRRLERVVDGFRRRGVQASGALLDAGKNGPATAVLAAADRLDAGLIVAGAFGQHPAQRLLTGSTTLQLVRSADCPLFLSR